MTGQTIGLFVAALAGFIARIAVERWVSWNERVKHPILGESQERNEQNGLAWSAIWVSAIALILFLFTFIIPPDILITIISK